MNILVRRIGALGDVVMTTPIVQRLHQEVPDAAITVQTCYPDVFSGNPCVTQLVGPRARVLELQTPRDAQQRVFALFREDGGFSEIARFVDLDLAYEKRPGMHIVQAYMQETFADEGHT